MKKSIYIISIVLIFALLFTACSGKEETTSANEIEEVVEEQDLEAGEEEIEEEY